MKLTKSKLKQIIKEELRKLLQEQDSCDDDTDCRFGKVCAYDPDKRHKTCIERKTLLDAPEHDVPEGPASG